MSAAVRRLGAAAGRLHERLDGLQRAAFEIGVGGDGRLMPQYRAISRIILDALCGAYHDYRSGKAFPKADLIDAINAIPPHPAIDAQLAAFEKEVVAGWYDEEEDEAKRFAASVAPPKTRGEHAGDIAPDAIALTPREYKAFVWLYRYVEVYGRAPLVKEIAAGIDTSPIEAWGILRRVAAKGAAAHVGGKRGWVPTRCP